MRYIFILLILVSSVSFAESPVIWDGDYAKSLAVGGFEQDSGKLLYDCLTVDPSSGGGVAAPVGSFCQYGSGGVGKLFIKVGAADTAWSEVSSSSTGWSLTGNAGTVAGTNFLGTTDAVDLVFKTNNTEYLRITSAGVLDTTFGLGVVHSSAAGLLSSSAVDLASADVTGVLPNANTTAASANTASAIVARDGSGNFSASTVTASLSGNASTATALAANPTDCGAGTKATDIDASGNLTCSAVANADISAGVDAAKIADGSVSNTEFQYINSVTSDVQGQINAKFTLPALTSGSVLFSNGTTIAQDNANLFWDDTNNRLGIGTASPGYREHIKMAGATGVDSITWEGSGASASRFWNWMPDSSGFLYMKNLNEAYYSLVFDNVGRAGFGKSSPVSQFHVQPRQANFIVSIFQGYAAQTADLTEWQDSAATVLAKVDSTGKAFFPNLNVSSVTSSLPAKFDASKNITSGAIDLASAEVTGILPNANTTATSANTASAIVARDGSGNFTAGTITAALTGNASTATALAANPSDCAAGTKATGIDASGNLTCSAVALASDVSGTLPVANGGTGQTSYTDGQLLIGNSTGNTLAKSTLTAGSGVTITNGGGSITIAQTDPSTSAISASDIDWATLKATGGLYTKTLSANTTFTFSNKLAGETIVVRLTNTASNYTVTFPAGIKWSGGSQPTQTIGAKSDVWTFIYDGTDTYGSVVQNF